MSALGVRLDGLRQELQGLSSSTLEDPSETDDERRLARVVFEALNRDKERIARFVHELARMQSRSVANDEPNEES